MNFAAKLMLGAAGMLGLLTCRPERSLEVRPAFYHWKTRLAPGPSERQWLEAIDAQRLYVKFFDVDWDESQQQAVPLAILEADSRVGGSLPRIIPVVFITNRCLKKLPKAELPELATKLVAKIRALALHWPPPEVQLDCDWTDGTRQAYFELLTHIRARLPVGVPLSATIRLHQYRHPKLRGVPPVERGMLMFYNMGELDQWEEPNSILNLAAAAEYLEGAEAYPIPLDMALPAFSWGVLFRQGKLVKLITGLQETQLSDTSRFRPLAEHRYELKKSGYWHAHYLYAGDKLRLEQVEAGTLAQAAQLLRSAVNTDTFFVAFYHLDSTQLSPLQPHKPQEVWGEPLQKCLKIVSD